MSQQYKVGDVIFIRSDIMYSLYHVGIVFKIEDNYFISQNTPYKVNSFGGSVSSMPLEDWLSDREILDIVSTGISSEYIMNASYEMRFRKYDVLRFNCEHYISIIENGKGMSTQVNRWFWIVVIILAAISGKRL